MNRNVVIAGGGIAGMTAATLLAEAGLKVTLCESSGQLGGKAKSSRNASGQPVEHSMRIYSSQYRILLTLLSRIPDERRGSVIQNLVGIRGMHVFRNGDVGRYAAPAPIASAPIIPGTGAKKAAGKLFNVALASFLFTAVYTRRGVPFSECLAYLHAHLRILWRCRERMDYELCDISYQDYLACHKRSDRFRHYFLSLPQVFVAARPDCEARAIARMMQNLLFYNNIAGSLWGAGDEPANIIDTAMMMDGPTSERMISPWQRYLESKGVEIRLNAPVSDLQFTNGEVKFIGLADGQQLPCGYAILAVPYLMLMRLCQQTALGKHAPHLNVPHRVRPESSSGIQCFLRDLPHGKEAVLRVGAPAVHVDSPWHWVSVIQGPGFWRNVPMPEGTRYVFSATWSSFQAPGPATGKSAAQCSPDEILEECLTQCKIDRSFITGWQIDNELQWLSADEYERTKNELRPHVSYEAGNGMRLVNFAPLMILLPGARSASPKLNTEVPNLFLAGEATWSPKQLIGVPTMEKAAESGYFAALEVLKHAAPDRIDEVTIPYIDPWPLASIRALDKWVWDRKNKKNREQAQQSAPTT